MPSYPRSRRKMSRSHSTRGSSRSRASVGSRAAAERQQSGSKSEKYHRVESFYGSFALPDNVSADNIRCESKDGVLTVHIPKAKVQKTQPKQISVQ